MIFGSCHFLFHQFTQRDEPYQIVTDMDALAAFSAAFIRSPDMGLFESMLPESISLTDEQFQIFLEKTIAAEHSRRILDGLTTQQGAQPPARNVAYTEAHEDTDEDE